MKFTSIPKKLVLTGMSAAMVVAFAPAVASASVYDSSTAGAKTDNTPKTELVATVTWDTATTTGESQKFESDQSDPTKAAYSDDDALQAALTRAAILSETSTNKNIKVTLAKDVTVQDINDGGSADKYYLPTDDSKGLIATSAKDSKVTVDYGSYTITNKDGKTQTITVGGYKTNAQKTTTKAAETKNIEVYSVTDDIAELYQAVLDAQTALDKAKATQKTAQEAYDAIAANHDELEKAVAEAKQKVADKQKAATEAENELIKANTALEQAREATDATAADISAKQEAYNKALDAYNTAAKELKTAQDELAKAQEGDGAFETNEANKKIVSDLNDANTNLAKAKSDIVTAVANFDKNVWTDNFQAADGTVSLTLSLDSDYNVTIRGGYALGPVSAVTESNSDARYVLDANGFFSTANQNTKVTGEAAQKFEKYTIQGTKAAETKDVDYTFAASDANVSITGTSGSVVSATADEAVNVESGATATLDGAKVTTTKAKDAIVNEGTVSLQGGADIEATLDGDTNADGVVNDEDEYYGHLAGIKGGTVTSPATKAPYENVATVNVSYKNADDEQPVAGIVAKKVKTESTITVNATSEAGTIARAKVAQTNPWTGVIGGALPEVSGKAGTTYAVIARNVELGYGNYTADYAVVKGNGTDANGGNYVRYGTYNGYVTSYVGGTDGVIQAPQSKSDGIFVSGGKFKYDPSETIKGKTEDGKDTVLQFANTIASDYNTTGNYKVAQNSADSYYYVYRVGQVNDVKYQFYNGDAVEDYDYMHVDTKGLKSYANDAAKAQVFAGTAIGVSLNDGNDQTEGYGEKQPVLDLQLTASYGTPTEEAAKDGKYETAYGQLVAQGKQNIQTAQGVYSVTGQTLYGKDKKQVKADTTDLLGGSIAVTADKVTTNANAAVYALGETTSKVDADYQSEAVNDNGSKFATITWTANLGQNYGVLYTSNADAVKQAQAKADAAQKAAEQKAEEAQKAAEQKAAEEAAAAENAAKAKTVTDDISQIPDLAANGSNYQAVIDAANAAQAAYDALTDTQKALVTNYSDIATKKAAAEQAGPIYEQTKAAKAKKVKGLKVKAGKKKATVSWKKASGYKYQLKYRQKNSSKTADFKYKKTSKTKVTVKSLKSKKYYNFKVRTYKKINGKNVYGKWTNIVTAKIK